MITQSNLDCIKTFQCPSSLKKIIFYCVHSHFCHVLNSFTNCIEHDTYCPAWMQQTGMEGDVDSRNVHNDVVLQLGHVNSRTRRVASTRWCVVAIHPDWCCLLLVLGGLQFRGTAGSLGSHLSLHPLLMVCTGAHRRLSVNIQLLFYYMHHHSHVLAAHYAYNVLHLR